MNLNINQIFSLKWREARGTLSVLCKHSMKIPLKMYKYFFFFFNCGRSDKQNAGRSGRMSTNCHTGGVQLRSTVVDSICSTLCLRRVHIVWQKTEKSSLLSHSPFLAQGSQAEIQATTFLSV